MKNKYDIIWLQSIDSTNNEAKRHIDKYDNLSVVSALSQTAGRGQRGNTWSSEKGLNLMFSIILKDIQSVKAADQFILSEITALAVTDFLSSHGIKASIKWPNDIYIADRKVCGILIENSIRGEWLSSSIIGIGLNVNQRNFDVNLPNPTSMLLENGNVMPFDIKICLEELMDIFSCYSESVKNIQNRGKIRERYLELLWRKDSWHQYLDIRSGEMFSGRIRDISGIGHLIIENKEGELNEFAFKEIAYIL